jgi:hypothetical protein
VHHFIFFEPDLVLFCWKKISLQFYFIFPSVGASPLLVVVVVVVIVLGCVRVCVL